MMPWAWGRWGVAGAVSLSLALLIGCSSSDSGGAKPEPLPLEVKTVEGPVRGEVASAGDVDGKGERMVRVFRGIPYGAPPVGPNRWRRTQPVAPWTDTREATAFGKRCPQPTTAGEVATDNVDEDCLTLNVWTPADKPAGAGGPMPVMVWIHGGAFTTGSGSDEVYEASKLAAATGAMIVTINYRLGVFGFMGSSALAAEDPSGSSGNWGLWDQRAALEWVARNAGAFGGDPNNVTIFGESAGGLSVSLLAIWPEVAPLFHRAVVQSGAIGTLTGLTMADAEREAGDLAKAVGCAAGDLACLRAKPAAELVGALAHTEESQPFGGTLQGSIKAKPWVPIVDGHVIREQPSALLARGAIAKVPYLIGTTRDEGKLFHAGLLGDKKLTSEAQYAPALAVTYGEEAATAIAARYAPSAFGGDPNEALARVTTLSFFVCPARRMARATRDAGNPTFVYQLHRTPNGGLAVGLGPAHATDLVFLFDSETGLAGRAGDDARGLVASMQSYWASFARGGAPVHDGSPEWPAFAADERHLVLDVPISAGAALEKDDCDFWDTMPAPLVVKTYAPPP